MTQRSLQEISDDMLRARDMQDADAMVRHAEELEALGTTEARAIAARARGTVYLLRDNNLAEALGQFHYAIALYTEMNDRTGLAKSHRNVAVVYEDQSQYDSALEHYHQALNLYMETGDDVGAARTRRHLGIVMKTIGNNAEAFSLFHQALETFTREGSTKYVALTLNNLALVHKNSGQYPEALELLERSLQLAEELGDLVTLVLVTDNIGSVYYMIEDFPLAIAYRERALQYAESIGDERRMGSILSNIGNVYLVQSDIDRALSNYRKALDLALQSGSQIEIAHSTGLILGALARIGLSEEADQHLATLDAMSIPDLSVRLYREACRAMLQEHRGMLDEAKDTLLAALKISQDCSLPFDQVGFHGQLRDLALKQNDLASYVEHNNAFQRINEEINGKETATKLAMQAKQREIDAREREHEKQLAVLHSTLPKEVAERVARGEVVNDHYDNASVIFLDIVGFTELSSQLSSQEVIALLDDVFSQCDAICAKHGVTKIKTIGDSYMCVAFDNVINAALAAIEMSRVSISHSVSHSVSHEVSHSVSHEVLFRIGIHCGPVTAGVIGKERMQYDVWGDTVNVASRMESSGSPGRIHVSQAFADNLNNASRQLPGSCREAAGKLPGRATHEVSLVTRHSSLVTFFRGSIDVKGKGLMQTYWLDSSL